MTNRNKSVGGSRPGAKAKFGNADALLSLAEGYVADGNDEAGLLLTDLVKMSNRGLLSKDQQAHLKKLIQEGRAMGVFSRPGAKARFAVEDRFYFGQPERFEMSDTQKASLVAHYKAVTALLEEARDRLFASERNKDEAENRKARMDINYYSMQRDAAIKALKREGMMSKSGQPERFDASSLERGDFAEASKSPMLGKLLSAKAMPDGGWRAVQAGSDTLVISFEDADLARDFGRRVASKGYSATSPVATTGRYWNVEVKNG